MKTCTACNEAKELSEYSKRVASPDGLCSCCRICKQNRDKTYYKENRVEVISRITEYTKANKEKIRTWRRQYQKEKYSTDINYKLRRRLRLRIYQALCGRTKPDSVLNALGCTVDELRLHLEAQFQPNMTWDNYGRWHIDHIKPLVAFNLEDRQQFESACHYTNLQPLWAMDNLLKGTNHTPIDSNL